MQRKIEIGLLVFAGLIVAYFAIDAWRVHMDKKLIHDELYTGPVKTYVAGRYVFEAPVDFEISHLSFSVTPKKSDEDALASYDTERIFITEIPWKSDDHEGEFAEYMREKLAVTVLYDQSPVKRQKYVLNKNADDFFMGHKAVCLGLDLTRFTIHSYIMLPQGILHLQESRVYFETPKFTEIEQPAAELFKHYRWGKPLDTSGNVFYTLFGRVENYPSQEEEVYVALSLNDNQVIQFKTKNNLHVYGGNAASTADLYKISLLHGVEFHRLREREATYGGRTQMEYIDKMEVYNTYQAHCLFILPRPELSSPQSPEIHVTAEFPWPSVIHMMPIWNSMLRSIRPVAQAEAEL